MRLRNWGEIMAEYVDRFALRDALYDADAITMRGVKIINQFPTAVDTATVQWIPVTERLPDNDDFVLVVASGQAGNIRLDNAFELGQFSMSEGWILEMWPEWEDPKVTHWMPLPEPPEAEAAQEEVTRYDQRGSC